MSGASTGSLKMPVVFEFPSARMDRAFPMFTLMILMGWD
jgi:hypothetical protein